VRGRLTGTSVVGVNGVEVTDCALTVASAGTKPMRSSGAAALRSGSRTRTAGEALADAESADLDSEIVDCFGPAGRGWRPAAWSPERRVVDGLEDVGRQGAADGAAELGLQVVGQLEGDQVAHGRLEDRGVGVGVGRAVVAEAGQRAGLDAADGDEAAEQVDADQLVVDLAGDGAGLTVTCWVLSTRPTSSRVSLAEMFRPACSGRPAGC
jgi:hypothetical protein